MAVFTELSDEDRVSITTAYGMMSLSSVIGIADGDTETTYLFRTKEEEYIVTLFENGAEPLDLERAFVTMETLHRNGVPCPRPIRTVDGSATFHVAERLVAVVTFVPGSSTSNATDAKCVSLGRVMAQIHTVLERKVKRVATELPTGAVHGALVHDNVFYIDDRVSGVINFRLRHDDVLVSEVADALVSWTGLATGKLDKSRAGALLRGYQEVRQLSEAEMQALPAFVMASVSRRFAGKNGKTGVPEIALAAYETARNILNDSYPTS
ncbi:phosphotransferase [Neorhizobium huautlense]|uniref:phosphotransferase n=1 Tax=Neorhizobium huautlense TaxID=67774 RepID=UPI000CF99E93|nr:phosphotransferase [Neorhizobium huautlense]